MIWVIIPVYQYEHISPLCHDLLEESEYCNILIVDNGGKWDDDWERAASGIEVVNPHFNLGWVGGINYGTRKIIEKWERSSFLWLNDDTRLSPSFVRGLRATREGMSPQAIVGPMYDDVWPQQKCGYSGPAKNYVAKNLDREVRFIDGTAMYVPSNIFDQIGYLDEEFFPRTGWGADFDYCLRASEAGFPIMVTERAYLNHKRGSTARKLFSNYELEGGSEMNYGMTEKYGPDWKKRLGIT